MFFSRGNVAKENNLLMQKLTIAKKFTVKHLLKPL